MRTQEGLSKTRLSSGSGLEAHPGLILRPESDYARQVDEQFVCLLSGQAYACAGGGHVPVSGAEGNTTSPHCQRLKATPRLKIPFIIGEFHRRPCVILTVNSLHVCARAKQSSHVAEEGKLTHTVIMQPIRVTNLSQIAWLASEIACIVNMQVRCSLEPGVVELSPMSSAPTSQARERYLGPLATAQETSVMWGLQNLGICLPEFRSKHQ